MTCGATIKADSNVSFVTSLISALFCRFLQDGTAAASLDDLKGDSETLPTSSDRIVYRFSVFVKSLKTTIAIPMNIRT